ncbi:hypothetical protein B0H19DRAFT_1176065 [Mycena capillaripes]|nr:hypothetical protein B0H19DRAFT_1176065 [Mycena capillaripes]
MSSARHSMHVLTLCAAATVSGLMSGCPNKLTVVLIRLNFDVEDRASIYMFINVRVSSSIPHLNPIHDIVDYSALIFDGEWRPILVVPNRSGTMDRYMRQLWSLTVYNVLV